MASALRIYITKTLCDWIFGRIVKFSIYIPAKLVLLVYTEPCEAINLLR